MQRPSGSKSGCHTRPMVRRSGMASSPLPDLLKLSARDRAQLAIALWESLSEADRAHALELTDAQRRELDRRWAAHLADPDSAIDWSDVRRELLA